MPKIFYNSNKIRKSSQSVATSKSEIIVSVSDDVPARKQKKPAKERKGLPITSECQAQRRVFGKALLEAALKQSPKQENGDHSQEKPPTNATMNEKQQMPVTEKPKEVLEADLPSEKNLSKSIAKTRRTKKHPSIKAPSPFPSMQPSSSSSPITKTDDKDQTEKTQSKEAEPNKRQPKAKRIQPPSLPSIQPSSSSSSVAKTDGKDKTEKLQSKEAEPNKRQPKAKRIQPPSPPPVAKTEAEDKDQPEKTQNKEAEPIKPQPKAKRKKIEWTPVEVNMSVKRKPSIDINCAIASSSLNGMTHEMPKRTPRIMQSLDGKVLLAPFFTNAFVFSNHFKCQFTVDGLDFCCTEQFYMYYKAVLFGDDESAKAILRAENAKDIKRMGAQIRLFNTAKWRKVSILVMVIANLKKFEQNPVLRRLMFETGDALLIEASPDDIYWGIGIHVDNPASIRDMKGWLGKNVMGRILTRIRDEFKKRKAYQEEWEEVRNRLPMSEADIKQRVAAARKTI